MEALLAALELLTPLNILTSIFGGAVFGFAYRNIYIDSQTIFLFMLYLLAFTLGRIIFVGVASASTGGAGLVGTFLFVIYVLSSYLTRKFFRRNIKVRIEDKEIKL